MSKIKAFKSLILWMFGSASKVGRPWHACLFALFGLLPQQGAASAGQVCDAAARVAARATGVPESVLRAITRTETGRRKDGQLQPWPWTVNMEGAGNWFHTRMAATAYVFENFQTGARSFDIGCFQINYKWHGHAFASIEEMFDPNANALYAAQFLQTLHDELGNWSAAAGAFHSRTPKYAEKYVARFDQIYAELQPVEALGIPGPETVTRRENRFPLLITQEHAPRRGSLVPLGGGTAVGLLRAARPLTGG